MRLETLEKEFKDFKVRVMDEHERLKEELKLLRDIAWNLVRAVEDTREVFRAEMKELREEFRAEMKEMREEFQAEMKELREEFRAEMKEMREEFQAEMKEMRKRWGDLARSLGTVTENIFAPGVPYLIQKLGCRVIKRMLDVEYEKEGRTNQYDAIVVAKPPQGKEIVFVAEVKTKLKAEHFQELKEKLENLLEYEPEYATKRIVPILAAFKIPSDLIRMANKRGVLLVHMGGEYLEPLNPEVLSLSEG